MEKVGERSVRFTFNDTVDREFPLIIAASTPILPKHAIDPETFDQSTLKVPLGSGPYLIKSVSPGQRIVYERDEKYWGKDIPAKVGFDNYDRISVEYFLEDNTLFEAFKKGEIDIYPDGSPTHWARAYNFPAIRTGDAVKEAFTPQLRRACWASCSTRAGRSLQTSTCAPAFRWPSISSGPTGTCSRTPIPAQKASGRARR